MGQNYGNAISVLNIIPFGPEFSQMYAVSPA